MLIRSTICAILTYVMQTTRLLRSIYDIVDKKIQRFLWGGTLLARKIHISPWTLVMRTNEGELGILAMRALNATSLIKLGWRMVLEP